MVDWSSDLPSSGTACITTSKRCGGNLSELGYRFLIHGIDTDVLLKAYQKNTTGAPLRLSPAWPGFAVRDRRR